MNTSKTMEKLLRQSILVKTSLICILTLGLNACLPLTIFGGAVGVADSLHKSQQIGEIQNRLNKIENLIKENEDRIKPYVPSFVDMDTYNKSFIDGKWDKDKRKK